MDTVDGPVIARAEVPKCNAWTSVDSPLSEPQSGIHSLIVLLTDDCDVEID